MGDKRRLAIDPNDTLTPALEPEENQKFTLRVRKFFKRFLNRFVLIKNKVRNRTPESLVNFFKKNLAPYTAVIFLVVFSLIADYARAAENSVEYVPSAEVMDLAPADVADIASGISSYTTMVEVDPVTVALAMDNSEFLGKPLSTETQISTPPPTASTATAPNPNEKRSKTITYTVDGGDTLSSIGWQYGLKIVTIKTLNNLSGDTIKPGQQLKLPPQDLDPKTLASLKVKKTVSGAQAVNRAPGSKNNAYPYGWCTYYVATRRYVPGGWGNARSWLSSARRSGYKTGSEPAVGSIVVTNESWMGHVAFVEAVNGNSVTIAEMNYVGWGVASRRTISAHGGHVMGYVY